MRFDSVDQFLCFFCTEKKLYKKDQFPITFSAANLSEFDMSNMRMKVLN